MPKFSLHVGEAWDLKSSPLTSPSWALSSWKVRAVTPTQQPTGADVGGRAKADKRREARTACSQMTHRPSNS